MKLIVEHFGENLYIYRETERHFAAVEPERSRTLQLVAERTVTELGNNCLVGDQLRSNEYVVVTLI